jgi:hypothetical protein
LRTRIRHHNGRCKRDIDRPCVSTLELPNSYPMLRPIALTVNGKRLGAMRNRFAENQQK